MQNIAFLQCKHLRVGDLKTCHNMLLITAGTCTRFLMHWSHLIESSKIVLISTGVLAMEIV